MLKKILLVLGALVALVLVCGAAAFAIGNARLNGRMDTAIGHGLVLPTDSSAIANGERLSIAYGCRDCHGQDLGGSLMIDESAFMVLHAPNLTSGEGGRAHYTSDDWERAVRHGIGADGRALIIMPSTSYAKISDQDLGEIVAFLESLEPIDRSSPGPALGPASRVAALMAAGELVPATAINHEKAHIPAIVRGSTVEYGAYLADAGCASCHGNDFSGGTPGVGSTIPPANLTPHPEQGLGGWTFEDFDRALRSGRRPDGSVLDVAMPWAAFSALTYDEALALWRYLETVPPVDVDRSPAPE